jgi:hypothetical protein
MAHMPLVYTVHVHVAAEKPCDRHTGSTMLVDEGDGVLVGLEQSFSTKQPVGLGDGMVPDGVREPVEEGVPAQSTTR